jgi:hypothetical protein
VNRLQQVASRLTLGLSGLTPVDYNVRMTLSFTGEVFYWRGPAPFYFVRTPPKVSQELKDVMKLVTYGWGMIPCSAHVGGTEFTTALIPKDGAYLLPLKDKVRLAEGIEEGGVVTAWIEVEGVG